MKLTVADAAEMLGVDESVVYRWIRERAIPAHHVDDHYRFHASELLEWANARGMRIASEEFRDPDAHASAMPTIAEALEAGGVHHGVSGTDRASVIRAVVELMPVDDADRGELEDFLLAREELGSTAIGEGIAIPHVRRPIILDVPRGTITLCFLEHPVDFGAPDGKPVDTVFTLVTTTVRAHLYLLSQLSAALHDPAFKELVARKATFHDILTAARGVA